MYKIRIITLLTAVTALLTACNDNKVSFDASGSFEAEETIISSEATGTIKQFNIEEGQTLGAGQEIGYIDSLQLYLKKKQLEAQITAILGKKPNIPVQLSALQEQLKTTERERTRVANLVKGDAATPKQLDDINAQIEVLKKQIEAQQSTLSISSEGLSKDIVPLQVQVEQLNDQLAKCKIINPANGTVLAKYAEANEMTTTGKPLYKIADLSNIILRAYITSNQLTQIKLNQKVKVLTDDGKGGYKETEGTVTWINDKAEFTPKTIQTKDERANMVYAVKIKVKNDGSYKVGMYGEIKFQ
ncbi:HlyD family secretion protein [Epilithonimonas vandammei]|mgnify:FL=1|jgi:HlyD family secretion protein|uniref:HlyD family efflux transporter periplasmic adaptor subunit n=1 Tax=Epilithonimonas vandammei TaxID=2487072 RepID=A0A3G8Y6K7_9FLAO|nr:HlyD family efflux transporter periplasmic adaptor subunit [Epilithonimonas vandammei]AZI40978.1 HlyD family efflux transporter periplasmic adaptor subunit [Epilithonimonas vandammei]